MKEKIMQKAYGPTGYISKGDSDKLKRNRQSIRIGKYLFEQSPLTDKMVIISIINDGEGGTFDVTTIEKLIDDAWSEIF